MLRLLFWLVVAYVVWKVALHFTRSSPVDRTPPDGSKTGSKPPELFSDVQEAEFEDITSKSPPEQTNHKQDR